MQYAHETATHAALQAVAALSQILTEAIRDKRGMQIRLTKSSVMVSVQPADDRPEEILCFTVEPEADPGHVHAAAPPAFAGPPLVARVPFAR